MAPEAQSAGATPAVEGATPSQTPAQPAAGTTPEQPQAPATGADDQLSDAGKRALTEERTAKRAAERERDALRTRVEELENASRSDAEKAVATARKEGEQAADARWVPLLRGLRIEGALRDAGCTKAALAARSTEFEALKVGSDGSIEGLDSAVEAFKTANPDLFPPTTPTGDIGQGVRGTPSADVQPGYDRLVHAYSNAKGS